MDSLTQIALGAAVGEAVLGRKVGRRAMLWGALCGTLPDLDVFVPLGDAVRDFTYHRSASHSLLVLAALTPIIVWLILKLHPDTREHRGAWGLTVYLVFATHVLLDCFTTYGTQIFWPISTAPVAWSSIFIIDPLYTLPLLIGTGAALWLGARAPAGARANLVGLALSTLYLGWTLVAKAEATSAAESTLRERGVTYDKLLVTPAPFNSLLWRILAVDQRNYYEGFYSLLDTDDRFQIDDYPRRVALLSGLENDWSIDRLRWFTKGLYAVSLQQRRDVVITDLRMGFEPEYVFRFKVAEMDNPHARAVAPQRYPGIRSFSSLLWIWNRIWDSEAER